MPPAPGRASAWQACGPSQNVLSGSCSLACGDTFIVLTIIVYPMSGSPRFADRRGGAAVPPPPPRRRSISLYIDLLKRDDLLDQLSRDVARQLQAPVAFRRWEDLWDYVDASVGRGLTVVLDEFQ